MTAGTTTVETVLRAIERHTLGPLMPNHYRQQIAAPTARVMAGGELDDAERRAVARALLAAGEPLAGVLESLGFALPEPPSPVEREPVDAGHSSRRAMAVVGPTGRIMIDSPFDLKDVVKAIPGAKMVDKATKSRGLRAGSTTLHPTWSLPATPAAAANLIETLSPYGLRINAAVRALADAVVEQRDARSLLDDGVPLPEDTPDGTDEVTMPLWTHQRRGVAYTLASVASLMAVKMGGGKTAIAIAAANRLGAANIIIVCPNRVRAVWRREVGERSVTQWHIEDGTRPPQRKGAARQDLPHPDRVARASYLFEDCDCGAAVHAFVVNYEALSQDAWQEWVPSRKIDLAIYDEIHRAKNHLTKPNRPKRTKGPAERALGPDATDAQLRAARALDDRGPREVKLRAETAEPSAAALQAARAADKAERQEVEAVKAKRLTVSGVLARWVDFTHRRIGLSGTPFPQHPWDAFGVLRCLDPGIFGLVWTPFKKEFLEMDRSGQYPKRVKPSKLAEFSEKATSIMYRPAIDLQLPETTHVLRPVELEPKARKAYNELEEALETDLRALLAGEDVEGRGGDGDGDFTSGTEFSGSTMLTESNLLTQLLRLQQLTGGTLRPDDTTAPDGLRIKAPEVRVSTAKTDQLAVFSGGGMTGGDLYDVGCIAGRRDADGKPIDPEPVVVYCRFRSDLDAIADVARKAKLRYGEISGRRADGLGDDGRMSPDVDLCAVQIQSGGTGVDLTRSAVGIWYSLGYHVADYEQALARQHRPGQTRAVLFIHYVATDTKDEAVYDAIAERKDAIAAVLRSGGIDPAAIGISEQTFAEPAPSGGSTTATADNARSAVTLPWKT